MVLAVPLSSCAPGPSVARGRKPNDTQVVAQWSLAAAGPPQHGLAGFGGATSAVDRCLHAESVIEKESGGVYFEDGNDIGGGMCNIYLYTNRVDETVARLVGLTRAHRLPSDLRVGVAVYKNSERSDWTYRVAYPSTLARFDLLGG